MKLNHKALLIWDWCRHRNLTIKDVHLPGKLNVRADKESRRQMEPSDWKLKTQMFQKILQKRGPLNIDLFAARHNTQVPEYFSWHPNPEALATDASCNAGRISKPMPSHRFA